MKKNEIQDRMIRAVEFETKANEMEMRKTRQYTKDC